MKTIKDFKEPKRQWSISGKHFSVQVSCHISEEFMGMGKYRWCIYGFVYPEHPLFSKFKPEENMYQQPVDEAPLHWGISYFQPHFDGNKITSFQFGCDYNHNDDDWHTHQEMDESVFGDALKLYDWLEEYGN